MIKLILNNYSIKEGENKGETVIKLINRLSKLTTTGKSIRNAVVVDQLLDWWEFITMGKDLVEISHIVFHLAHTDKLDQVVSNLQEGFKVIFL
jgi:hypothetical protein